MVHYIYKITFLCGEPKGRYYLGKRSYKRNDPSKDNFYKGSGIFCKRYFEKYGAILGKTYTKEIIEINQTFEANKNREIEIIGDLYKTDVLCMNMIPGGQCCNEAAKFCTTNKEVVQYDINGNIVNIFKSVSDAARFMNVCRSGITAACNGKQILSMGFIWRYYGDDFDKFNTKPSKHNSIKGKSIIRTDINTGDEVVYKFIKDAALELDVTHTCIRWYLNSDKIMWNKYKWRYKE